MLERNEADVSAECIHGLELALCDVCSPRVAPQPPTSTARARPTRASSGRAPSSRASTSRPRAGRAATPSAPTPVLEQRVFHVTHLENLEGILDAGGLLAGARPAVDVSSELDREFRRNVEVAPGLAAAECVPFLLDVNARLWDELRSGAADARWSTAAREANPTEFVLLVSTVGTLGDATVAADGDPIAPLTRFAASTDDRDRMLRRALASDDARLGAELLVREIVPFDALALIGVANERVRDRVRELLRGAPHVPRVVVYPPWFQSSEG